MNSDLRYQKAKQRLSSLSDEELKRILCDIDKILFDTHNFNEGKFCPVAIAMNLHKTIDNPTDERIKNEISKRFRPVNIFKGIKGKFYTDNRREDLINLCKEILQERKC